MFYENISMCQHKKWQKKNKRRKVEKIRPLLRAVSSAIINTSKSKTDRERERQRQTVIELSHTLSMTQRQQQVKEGV